ncbi:hypothetical protein [Streptomyces sp. NPDC002580]|uniref:hypothetical protein n=1 Tax=Streptomyces sp. NPDC002580 TaxID=3364653 RepID=UPI00367B1CF2
MADEKDSGNGSIRRRPWDLVWDLVVETVLLELAGLALLGVAALLAWSFGWLSGTGLATLPVGMLVTWPAIWSAVVLYRAGPPRRLAVVAAVLALAAVTLLVAAAANWAFPTLTGSEAGIFIGYLVAIPVGAAVFAWCLNRTNAA